MTGNRTVHRGTPLHRILFWTLAIGHLAVTIVLTLGAAYARLWFVVLSVSGLGLVLGSIMVAASLLGLVWLFHFGREPMLGWHQPWDHSFWIVAERRGSNSWQRLVNGAT